MRRLIAQFAQFGVVGGIGVVVNLVVFNGLEATIFDPAKVHEGPLLATIAATAVAIVTNWIGNRYWTFRKHRGKQLLREGFEFVVVSLGGMLIALACVWVSHYGLGYTSKLADNIANNVVGLVLGMAFRFALYKLWVFKPHPDEPELSPLDESAEPWTASLPILRDPPDEHRPHPTGATAPAPDARRAD